MSSLLPQLLTPMADLLATSAFAKSYHGATTIDPAGAVAIALLLALTVLLPRTLILLPLVLGMCFVPVGQRLVIATVDLPILRLLIMAALVRLIAYGEHRTFKLHTLDLWVIVWACIMLVFGSINGSSAVRWLGGTFDTLGAYFVARLYFQGAPDFGRLGRVLAIVVMPVALLLVYEKLSGRSPFGFFTGVADIADTRFGKVRARGAFIHPIICGSFMAVAFPIIATQLWHKGWRTLAAVGMVCCGAGILACASSGPILALAAGLWAVAVLPWRRWTMTLRWSGFATLVVLHFAMEAPVWHLLSRISISKGSTGWHRYHLIDQWIKHSHEWLLTGSSKGTAHWGSQLFDVTNHYVGISLTSGLLGLALFVLLMFMGWFGIGRKMRVLEVDVRNAEDESERRQLRYQRLIVWVAGALLFQHAVAFVGVSYFGQMTTFFWITFGAIASLGIHPVAAVSLQRKPNPSTPQPEQTMVFEEVPA